LHRQATLGQVLVQGQVPTRRFVEHEQGAVGLLDLRQAADVGHGRGITNLLALAGPWRTTQPF
jgi:hypothetical protein